MSNIIASEVYNAIGPAAFSGMAQLRTFLRDVKRLKEGYKKSAQDKQSDSLPCKPDVRVTRH